MKFLSWNLLFAGCALAAQLKDVKAVYVYPMPSGFDQHISNRLVNDHVFQVVSDPKLADAVITDQVGNSLNYKLEHINPAPPPPVPPPQPGVSAPSIPMVESAPHESTFTHGRGTVFLVDAKSKTVLWSSFQRPKNTTAGELNKTAKRVVERLEIALGGKPGDQAKVEAVAPIMVTAPAAPAAAPAPAAPVKPVPAK